MVEIKNSYYILIHIQIQAQVYTKIQDLQTCPYTCTEGEGDGRMLNIHVCL